MRYPIKMTLVMIAFCPTGAFSQVENGCPQWAQDELRKIEERSNAAIGNALTEEDFYKALSQTAKEKQRLPSPCQSFQDSSR